MACVLVAWWKKRIPGEVRITAFVLIIATFVLFVNLAIDLLYGWLDPRIRIP